MSAYQRNTAFAVAHVVPATQMSQFQIRQGDLLSELLKKNAGKGIKALGPDKQKGAFKVPLDLSQYISNRGCSVVMILGA